ncbi:MAG: hypothetical protein KatS3mg129_0241 [Leptospiraceae bacterium]|nr:MAG: hypothetical protein KatS3mg129_0241 [Leptospiraceae bacterium]
MPKKFKFSLEALLRLRTLEEEQAMQELGSIMQKINQAKEKVKELEIQYTQEVKKFSEYTKQGSYSFYYQSFERFLNRLENLKKQTEVYIESLQPELEEKRKKLVEARKKKKIIELLKEKEWQQYNKKRKKQETQELFELNQKNKLKEKEYEYFKQDQAIHKEIQDESGEDLKSRQERELREYYREKGIPFPES